MATLPDLANFDAGRFIGMQQAGQKRRTLAELGGLAAQGDLKGAEGAAWAGGMPDVASSIRGMAQQDQERLVNQAASWAYGADTPEKWEQGRGLFPGFDIGPFESRQAVLSQALTVQDRIAQANSDRSYGLDQQRLGLEQQRVAQAGAGGMEQFFGTPIPMEGPEGQYGVGMLSKTGNLHLAPNPEGFSPMDPYGKSFQTAQGRTQGELQGSAASGLPNALAKAEQGMEIIDQMLSHPGREAATGLSSVLDPRNYIAGTDATDFNVMRRQLEGKAFLEAFESLKGGGQITEIEGRKATDAMARLDTAQSDNAYRAALLELRGILATGMERARQRAGQGGGGQQQAPANLIQPTGQGDGWTDLGNGIRIREVQ